MSQRNGPGNPGPRHDLSRLRQVAAHRFAARRVRVREITTRTTTSHGGADGPVLAYCRSGTRSCHLWALAAAKAGRDPGLLVAQGAAAGYDLRPIGPTLDALAAEAQPRS